MDEVIEEKNYNMGLNVGFVHLNIKKNELIFKKLNYSEF
jgi:hypothetical protein